MRDRRTAKTTLTPPARFAALLLAAALPFAAQLFAAVSQASAQETVTTNGLSLIGEPKYAPDFEHFDYVKPDAPKGGRVRQALYGTFDSLNPFVVKGKPGPVSSIYDTLMADSMDEPSAEYGLLAKSVTYPEDFAWVEFALHDTARFHDGKPVTAADVVFSFEALTTNHPFYNRYYANVTEAEVLDEQRVRFTFDETGNRELPLIMGQLPVLPSHYWDGSDGRDISETTLVPPLGSGPYRIVDVTPGRKVVFERVDDYWGTDLPVNRGKHNFDLMVYEYFLDSTAMLEAFKGDRYDVRVENSAKQWATEYDFPAVKSGEVVLQTFTTRSPSPMQAFVFNTRREKFADRRVREAFNLAFDFEWMNKNIFFGQYTRTGSFFEGSELEATGLPAEKELELLEPLRGQVPDEVFTQAFENPKNPDTRAVRANLRKAAALLKDAGWVVKDDQLVNAETGTAMTVEFLLQAPTFERVVLPFKQSLKRLGIDVTVRTVDTSQFQAREEKFEFDIIVDSFGQSLSPGNEQRDFWGSESAGRDGSRNTIGIKDPAVDALIDKIIFAPDRQTLVAATRALDRVLLWNHYVIPQWWSPLRTARWDRFGQPETLPDYAVFGGFPTVWWYEEGAAAKAAGVSVEAAQ
jgi:microcin C transport system substrate-binding protein